MFTQTPFAAVENNHCALVQARSSNPWTITGQGEQGRQGEQHRLCLQRFEQPLRSDGLITPRSKHETNPATDLSETSKLMDPVKICFWNHGPKRMNRGGDPVIHFAGAEDAKDVSTISDRRGIHRYSTRM
ncbi:hypothetical protein TrVFT333_002209 [Trichoderma virens FT-333]|nr:hypothetical protein TrVFT333_002209 [Trichoderma virens FT-333]